MMDFWLTMFIPLAGLLVFVSQQSGKILVADFITPLHIILVVACSVVAHMVLLGYLRLFQFWQLRVKEKDGSLNYYESERKNREKELLLNMLPACVVLLFIIYWPLEERIADDSRFRWLSCVGYILGLPSGFIWSNSSRSRYNELMASLDKVEEKKDGALSQKLAVEIERKITYREELGKRHKQLRENYLKLTRSEMANFYGFKNTYELAEYEDGEKEFPIEALNRAIAFFFINPKFLEEGTLPVFRRFYLYSNEPTELVKLGFKPHFLCLSEMREDLYAYVLLQKVENGYTRTIIGEPIGRFASNGGGRDIIEQIIPPMIKYGLRESDISALVTDAEIRKTIENGTFYCKNTFDHLGFSRRDYDCEAIFHRWFWDSKISMQNENERTKIDIEFDGLFPEPKI